MSAGFPVGKLRTWCGRLWKIAFFHSFPQPFENHFHNQMPLLIAPTTVFTSDSHSFHRLDDDDYSCYIPV